MKLHTKASKQITSVTCVILTGFLDSGVLQVVELERFALLTLGDVNNN